MRAPTNVDDAGRNGRRKDDRRKEQLPFGGQERRKGDRRNGTDRRRNPRVTTD